MPEDPAISVLSRSKNAAARARPLALGPAAGSGARPALSPAGARGVTERGCESGIGPALGLDPQDYRVALAPARADRCAAQPAAAAAQLEHEAAEDARARGADGVSQRDGPAVDVDALLVDAQHADRVQGHRGEGLVDLPEVDVARLPSRLLERLLGRAGGARRHVRGGGCAPG